MKIILAYFFLLFAVSINAQTLDDDLAYPISIYTDTMRQANHVIGIEKIYLFPNDTTTIIENKIYDSQRRLCEQVELSKNAKGKYDTMYCVKRFSVGDVKTSHHFFPKSWQYNKILYFLNALDRLQKRKNDYDETKPIYCQIKENWLNTAGYPKKMSKTITVQHDKRSFVYIDTVWVITPVFNSLAPHLYQKIDAGSLVKSLFKNFVCIDSIQTKIGKKTNWRNKNNKVELEILLDNKGRISTIIESDDEALFYYATYYTYFMQKEACMTRTQTCITNNVDRSMELYETNYKDGRFSVSELYRERSFGNLDKPFNTISYYSQNYLLLYTTSYNGRTFEMINEYDSTGVLAHKYSYKIEGKDKILGYIENYTHKKW
jgi:hypothetical protein